MRALAAALALCLIAAPASADTVTLHNGKDLKGLVVEQHADRIILSTEKGEIPILLRRIKNIQYDAPEQNFLQAGKAYEEVGRLGEALAYYQKAVETNPDFAEARQAAIGVRNRFWALSTEGPRGEIEKKQLLYDAWSRGSEAEELIRKKGLSQDKELRARLGISLDKKGDWLFLSAVDSKRPAAAAGLKRFDRLVALDGVSLRYLGVEAVRPKLLTPRYSNFTLEVARDVFIHKNTKASLKDLGVRLKLEYQGLAAESVAAGSPAAEAGLRAKDQITHVNGEAVRYTPIAKVVQTIESSTDDRIVFTVRRTALLSRG